VVSDLRKLADSAADALRTAYVEEEESRRPASRLNTFGSLSASLFVSGGNDNVESPRCQLPRGSARITSS
jgi:hypothetical protein